MGGPGKGVLKRSHFQNSSSSHDVSHHRPTHRRRLRLQDEEDNQEQENETMESVSPHISRVRRVLGSSVTIRNEYEEEHQELEHEVDFVQSETNTSEHQQDENIGSTSHGTTNTRKESRALTEGRKSRLNKGNLVFKVDECAGCIVGEDSQLFITKGGRVMREHAKFDGTT